MKNAVYFQSGGPTAVINSSLYGVIKAYCSTDRIDTLYGARHGLEGLIKGDLVEIEKDLSKYEEIQYLNGAILGTARRCLKDISVDDGYEKVLSTLKKHDIGYVFVNGGNDSMDTADKLNKYFLSIGFDCIVIGIPKTIDNDLVNTDHCPGFGSAVKYVVRTTMELFLDINAFNPGRVTVVEIMGRDAGWLAASSIGAKLFNLGPDLIYLPETSFDIERFIEDVKRVYNEKNRVLICVSEALKDRNGKYISMDEKLDSFGHVQLGSVSKYLVSLVEDKLKLKTRNIEFSLVQRCASHLQSKLDREEAIGVGEKAVEYALNNQRGMVSIIRDSDYPYKSHFELVSLSSVANAIKHLPLEYINEAGNYVNDSYLDYIRPFIDEDEINIKSGLLFLKK